MSSSENVTATPSHANRAVHVAVHRPTAESKLALDPATQALIAKGYVPVRQLTGKVVGVWGVAFLRDAEGHIQPLKVGDVVGKGEVVLTGQDGIIQIEAAKPAKIADLERVITELDQGTPEAAPAAGLQGGDGGDLQPGLRVDRITEAVTPATIGTEPYSGQTIEIRDDETAPQSNEDDSDNETANTAAPDDVSVTEDGSVNFDPRGNDSFQGPGVPAVDTVAGQPISVGNPVTLPQGIVTLNPDGTLTFTPAPDFNGSVTIPYTAEDGSGQPVGSTIVVTVTPVNDAPAAINDQITTAEDTPVVLDPRGNDTDADGDPLTITEINGQPINVPTPVSVTDGQGHPIGTVSLNPDGSLNFTPAPDYHGPADFDYTISDGQGGTSTGHVGLTVTPVADAPSVTADAASTPEGTAVLIDVLANDSDRDGDALTITEVNGQPISVGSTVHLVDGNGLPLGDVRLTADGQLDFTPAPGTHGPVDFSYTATDGRTPVQANVHVDVTPVNDAPLARDNTITGTEDSPVTFDPRSNDSDADGDALTITAINGQSISVGQPVTLPQGQLSLNADGTLTFTPASNYNGTLSFDYTVSDGQGGSGTAKTTLQIQPVDDLPAAGGDTFAATEDSTLSGSLGSNDSLSGDGGNTFALGTGAAHGTVVVNADGTFSYTPAANYNGPDSFTYTLTDADGDVSTATVTVNVGSVDDLPVAANDTFAATEDIALNGNLAGNDTLSGDGGNTFALGTGTAHGTVVVNAEGTFTYTPVANYNGPDSFTYTLTDADGDVSTATVTVNVGSVDDLPAANADTFAATEDTLLNGSVAGNDTLSGDGGNTFALGTGAAHGTVVVNANGTFTYTPAANYNGPDSFTYTLTDADGDVSTATVTVNVGSVDDLPAANADTFAATEDTVLNGSVAGNDTLSGDGGNTFALGTGAAHGTVVVNADGTFTYTSAANYNGPDSFTYTLTDADGDVSTATVTVNVGSVDDLPAAGNDTFAATEDTVLNGSVAGNDTLSGDGGNTFTLGTGAAHGTVVVNANGTFTYTPAANYNGPDSFTYTLTDADGDVSTATVTVNVGSVDDLPVAGNDTFAATEDTALNGSLAGNDTLSGDGGNTFALGTGAAHGTVVVNANGTFTYTPAANYNGPDSFTYTLTDADGDVSTATVTVNVGSVDDLPIAGNDTFAATEDTTLNGSLASNDTLSGDGGNTFALGTGAAHGTVVVNANGTFTYNPAANYNGPDSFTYTLTDADGDVSTATVTVNVGSVDDLPIAGNDTFAATEDTALNGSLASNDTLSGDGGNTFALGTGAAHGTVVVNANGTFTYTPAANYNGPDSFTYTLTDADGDVSTATVTVNVGADNDQPTAGNDTFAATEDTALNGNLAGNDTLSGDGGNTFAIGTGAAHGTVVVNADGTFTYTPVANYNGPDSFTYTLTDADGDVSTATVTVNVGSVDDLPAASDDTFAAVEDTVLNGSVAGNDTLSGDGGNTFALGTGAAHGTVVVNANGTFNYTPAANYNGPDSFTYTLTDADGDVSTATVSVNVGSVDDLPAAGNDTFAATEDTTLDGHLAGNDTLSGDGGNSFALGTGAAHGAVVVNANGTFTYTPAANYNGPDSFTYTLTDADGDISTATVTLNVASVDDLPATGNDTFAATEDTVLNGSVAGNDTLSGDGGNTFALGTGAAHGTVVVNADGTFTYTPAANYNGPDSFTYTLTDADGDVSTATVTVNVGSVDDLPTAGNDTFAATEDTALNGSLAGNDTLSGDGGNTFALGTGAAHGTVVVNANGTFTYTPAANYIGPDSFTYTLTDADGDVSTATVTLNVASVDDMPATSNDTFAATEDTVLNGSVTGNDTLSGDGGNTFALGTAAAHGTVVVNANGTFTYTPAANYNGPDSFTYTLTDADGDVSTATVTLNVASVDDMPATGNDTFAATEDTVLNGSVTGNDTLSGDGGNTFALGTAAAHGTVVVNANGTFTYTPVANYNGQDSFTYTLTDADGDVSTATVTVNVGSVDDLPVAANDTFAATEDTALNGNLAGNDTLSGDGGNVFALGTGAAHGTVVVNGNGTFTYTPAANYNGPDSFTYTLTDADGDVSTATVTLTVAAVDDASVLVADTNTVAEDTVATGNVLSNDSDVDNTLTVASFTVNGVAGTFTAGQTATITGVGTLQLNSNGTYTFTPVANWNGTVPQLTYTTNTGSSSTLNITVTALNDPSVLVADTNTVAEDTVATGNVLSNDSDVDNTLTVASFTVNGVAGTFTAGQTATITGVGTLQLNSNGTYTFTPVANWNGSVPQLTYTTNTGSSSTLSITVTPVDDLPTAGNDTFAATEDTVLNGSVAGNDTLSGDGGNTFALGTNAAHGTVVVNANGTFTYTPAANYNGPDSFTYTLTDADGDVSTATVTVNVGSIDDLPVAGNDTFAATEDTALNGNLAGNDTLSGDGGNTFALGTGAAHGTVVVNADGTFTYTPAANYNGPDSFTYTLTDADGDVSTATVTVNVGSIDDLPVAGNDTFAATEDTALNGNLAGNDTLSGDGGNTFALGNGAAHGTVVVNANGTFTYTPAANYNGPDSFTYTLTDADGDVSTATVTLNVAAVDDASVLVADTNTVAEDTVATGNVLSNDSDVDNSLTVASFTINGVAGTFTAGQTATITGVGTLQLNSNGTYTFTPVANWNGSVPQLTYTTNTGSSSTLNITVTAVNDPSVLAADTNTVAEDTVATGNVLSNDSDVDNSLTVASFTINGVAGTFTAGQTANITGVGTLQLNSNGNYTFTPVANWNGTVPQLTYTTNTGSSTTLNITVTAVDDAPTSTGGAVTGTEDTNLVFTWAQFNVADVDSAASSLGVQVTSLPTDGTLQFFNGSTWVAVTLNQTISQAAIAAGNLRFVPDANESGADTFGSSGTGNLQNDYAQFNFRPADGTTTGSTASMRIDITPVADTPMLTTRNHDLTVFTTSFEAADTGLTQAVLNPNTTSTSTLTQTTLAGWTRVDTPDAYAGGTNVWELWSNGDTMANQANTQIGVTAGTGNGQNWLELNNANNAGALVQTLGLSRSVTTTAGYVYDLSFDYAGRLGFSQDFTKITVLVDGVRVASYSGTSGQNGLNWENLHFSFVGTGGPQTITIITDANQFDTNGRGAMIDDIRLTESQGAQAGNAANGTKTEIALSGYITTALADTDGSETLSLTIGGLPLGATIITSSHPNGYTVASGAVTIPASELASARLQLSSSYLGDLPLTVTSTSLEPNGSTATSSASLNFRVVVGAGDVGTEGSTHTLASSTSALSTATGLHGEYFGYNETANQGQFYNVQAGDGTVGNLDSIADITSIINLRQGSNIVGTSASASNAAMDASFNATNLSYGQSVAVNNSLGSSSPTAVGNTITTGSLYNFLGAANAGNNTGSLRATSSFGQTTDAIVRMVGSAYFAAGTYDFQVRADDGFSIRIDGQVVMEYDANQSPTTRTTTVPVAIGEGLHTIEIVYWDQAGNAELLVQYKPSSSATYQTLGLDNLALFQSENAPALNELQDIIENPSVNGQYLIRTGQEAYGGTGADTITGSDGRDVIHGRAGNDSINGGGAADRLEGGAGNDTLTGGFGADTFRWELADHGSNGTPAVDTITDFDNRGYTSGGDRLDLRDLLVGESSGNLGSFISFERVGSNTVLHISSSGGFGSGYTASAEDQTIVLQNVDLTVGFTTDAQIIQDLLNRGKLVTD